MGKRHRGSEQIKNFFVPIESMLQRIIILLVCFLLLFQCLVLSAETRPYFSVVDQLEGEFVQEIDIIPASQLIE